jgi:arylsulfatase A-like enzyme
MDSLTLAFALEGVRALQLGGRGATDLLAVSLSTTDYVGHAYGPDSREIHDQVVRLDRYLGRFLEQLFVRYGRNNVLVVLTADHGVTPFPERSRTMGHPGAVRVIPDTIIRSVNAALDQRAGGGDWVQFESGMLMVPDRATLGAQGVNVDSVVADVATRLRALAGVARVDRPVDLSAKDTADPVVRRWMHQVAPDGGVELVATLKPYSIWSPANVFIAMHGQPTELDAHVPLILWGPGIQRGVYSGRVNTVDIAPTLARLLDLTPAEPLDGRVLTEALGAEN